MIIRLSISFRTNELRVNYKLLKQLIIHSPFHIPTRSKDLFASHFQIGQNRTPTPEGTFITKGIVIFFGTNDDCIKIKGYFYQKV